MTHPDVAEIMRLVDELICAVSDHISTKTFQSKRAALESRIRNLIEENKRLREQLDAYKS